MKLILTRHGETEENIKGIHQGQKIGGTLTKEGIEQAEKLALRLKDEKIDVIYSSDLKRAADTAKIIAKYHKDVPLIFVEELREGDSGSFAGKHKSEIDWNNRPADAETREDLKERGKKMLDVAYSKYPDKTVLFVAHNGINKGIMRVIMNKDVDDEIENQTNTAVNIFEIKEDKNHVIHLIGCTKHLD